ncbi:MAG TPA: hypothetical protein VEK34_05400 [Methylocella sp.]|nr:hypothetical protein [Methylocella sp.]
MLETRLRGSFLRENRQEPTRKAGRRVVSRSREWRQLQVRGPRFEVLPRYDKPGAAADASLAQPIRTKKANIGGTDENTQPIIFDLLRSSDVRFSWV